MFLNDVPLFPLRTVLFPKMILPLHIFEPRYRQMISECLRDNQPFGVILIGDGAEARQDTEGNPISDGDPSLYQVGTLATISEVTRLDDGRMLINTVGTQRFRLLTHREVKAYMTGDIEIWPDGDIDPSDPAVLDLVSKVTAIFQGYLEVLMSLAHQTIGLEIPEDPTVLSYLIPHWLPQISIEDKQRLLEVVNPAERLRDELLLLQRETEFLNKIKQRVDQENETERLNVDSGQDYNFTRRFSDN